VDAVAGVGPATVRLAFPPEPRLLGTVRLVVGIVARKAGMGAEGIEDLKVAVSETCAVAVGDLTRAGRQDPIEIDLVETPDRFGIEVRDRAPTPVRDAAGPDDPEVDDRELGLALVGALVDDLKTATLEGGGNRTSFWLRRDPLDPGGLGVSLLDPLEPGGLGLRPPDPDLPPPLT
jgi:anti-sigma regulatory factor (Ser/Thr protein kinase)